MALAEDLRSRDKSNLRECFIVGTFIVAKRGGAVGTTKRGKGTKIMALAGRNVHPLAVYVASAAPHEVTLVPDAVEGRFVAGTPERLI